LGGAARKNQIVQLGLDPFGANFAGQAIHDPYLLQAL
jgi:hypothetical protein